MEPCLAGPARPQDRVAAGRAGTAFRVAARAGPAIGTGHAVGGGRRARCEDGDVVIAAITSCTNTSNPQVMVAAGLLAKQAVERGLRSKPWVKTSLAPGSRVVMDYLERAGLTEPLEALGFYLVGFGCTTCIGNSGPLLPGVSEAVHERRPVGGLGAVGQPQLRGPHPPRRADELPGLAAPGGGLRAGRHHGHRPHHRAAGHRRRRPTGAPAADLWPSLEEVSDDHPGLAHLGHVPPALRRRSSTATSTGRRCRAATGQTFGWEDDSTYVQHPPFFEGMTMTPAPVTDIAGARVLAMLGDSVTTDHISPAGSIGPSTPGRPLPDRARRRAAATSTPTGPGGATTR